MTFVNEEKQKEKKKQTVGVVCGGGGVKIRISRLFGVLLGGTGMQRLA